MESTEKKFVNEWRYTTEPNGVVVREITIDSGKGGDAVEIAHMTDLHINYFNGRDLDESDPVLMSTREHRKWLANGGSLANVHRCMEMFKDSDQIVLTGDLLDFLSWGTLEKLTTEVFQKYGNVMACLGNHEPERRTQGEVEDTTPLQPRLDVLQEYWCNDIYYSSKVLGDKVMLIQMDNATRCVFWDHQVERIRADLATAREHGYTVLLFYHIPMSTGVAQNTAVQASYVGDRSASVYNFYSWYVGGHSTGASKEIYDLITNNGDIIKGAFCGHAHNDFYTEIRARTASGEETVIPQYTLIGVPYGQGHALRITVK